MAKTTKTPKAPKAPKETKTEAKAQAKTTHTEVNYVLTPEDVQNNPGINGVKTHRAFINDQGDLYIKQFGKDPKLTDIVLGKRKESASKEPGTYHSI